MKQEIITNSNITGKHWRSVMIMRAIGFADFTTCTTE